jgi:predicted GIY-YIG superfamily endonuclease
MTNVYIKYRTHYVYSLENPLTKEQFYIGYTSDLKNRYRVHKYSNQKYKKCKDGGKLPNYLSELRMIGLFPIMRIIGKYSDKKTALLFERIMIRTFKPKCNGTGINTSKFL